MIKKQLPVLAVATMLFSCNEQVQKPPNIIVIMADDLGFSDLGCTGAEIIETPNIDYLAENGIRFNQFYNASRCAPSRASLLTGHYPHTVGMGWMPVSDLGRPGYAGDMDTLAPTIAEVMQQNGYTTYMTGKWHVTFNKFQTNEGPKHNWPTSRGFDRFFGMLSGGGGYYIPRTLVEDDQLITPPDDFYLTDAINDRTVEFIEDHFKSKKEKPFFFYLAHYAPHFPLHAHQEDIEKYRGKFMIGWDSLRTIRYQNQLTSGLIDESWKLTPRAETVTAWKNLDDTTKIIEDAKMAVYAAQIHRMDQGIGRLIETLKRHNELDNTLIVFLSDNGPSGEKIGRDIYMSDLDNFGDNSTYVSYREPWANVSNVPFHHYKSYSHEGGISTPFIVHWPEKIKNKGAVLNQRGHIIDLMTTVLDVADAEYPGYVRENKTIPLQGVSLYPAFTGEIFEREAMFFEHESNRAIIKGEWKLVAARYGWPWKIGEWELYNIKEDPTEIHNLINDFPDVAERLENEWNQWGEENNVLPLDVKNWNQKIESSIR